MQTKHGASNRLREKSLLHLFDCSSDTNSFQYVCGKNYVRKQQWNEMYVKIDLKLLLVIFGGLSCFILFDFSLSICAISNLS